MNYTNDNVVQLAEAITSGDRIALGRGITLVESTHKNHRTAADKLLNLLLPYSGSSFRIGITGTPGVGKSTFIENLGTWLIEEDPNARIAVLSIDPSSQATGGSILGDKTRMDKLSIRPEAFIRPSPAGMTLGGVSRRTREAIILCESAGYEHIWVETVGVGQSESEVSKLTDCFLLLLLPGAGDELQGIKRGVVEMADFIVINKADSGREMLAKQSMIAYRNALHLFPPKANGSTPTVHTCSARDGIGIEAIWKDITALRQMLTKSNYLNTTRTTQDLDWLDAEVQSSWLTLLNEKPALQAITLQWRNRVLNREVTPVYAAQQIINIFADSD